MLFNFKQLNAIKVGVIRSLSLVVDNLMITSVTEMVDVTS